jgi:non-ribosomal peptide synthetase component E (peptide arylation enzyme)
MAAQVKKAVVGADLGHAEHLGEHAAQHSFFGGFGCAARGRRARAGLAAFKLPGRLEIVAEFPGTGLGKVSRKALAADIAAKLVKS